MTTQHVHVAITANLFRLLNVAPPWTVRAPVAVTLLDAAIPGVLMVQECTETQESYLLHHMEGPWLSSSDHVNTGVMARSDWYKKLDARPFTLWGTTRNRYASGVILQSLIDGTETCFVSPHPVNASERNSATDRLKQVDQLIAGMASWGVLDLPVVLGGDWNDSKSVAAGTVAAHLKDRGFIEDRVILKQSDTSIDRFFVNGLLQPLTGNVIRTGIASDHNWRRGTFVAVDGATPTDVNMPIETAEIQSLFKTLGPLSRVSLKWVNIRLNDSNVSRHVFWVQHWLRALDLYRGVIDGYGGPVTLGGLETFRRSHALKMGTKAAPITMETLQALRTDYVQLTGEKALPVEKL
jgi:hypothetical protein